ncbi:unnamed protein product [Linum trigynum]|uniref:Pectinesterase inhibitor domain-containing protein n=1 Tax=Linum trigynum TaxID=586398 RepID=A0AAV2D3F7_9ROSI
MASSLQTIRPYVITVLCLLMMLMIKPAESDQALVDKVCSSGENVDSSYCQKLFKQDAFSLASNLSGLARIALANIKFKASFNKKTFVDTQPDIPQLCSDEYDSVFVKVRRACKMNFENLVGTGNDYPLEETVATVLSGADACYSDFSEPLGSETNKELIKLAAILQCIIDLGRQMKCAVAC